MKTSPLLHALFLSTAFGLAAAELAPAQPSDYLFGEKLTAQNGALSVKSNGGFYSNAMLPVDTAKLYRLSGEFRQTAGPGTGVVKFGIVPATKHQQITPENINVRPDTETELAADCRATDTVLKVKDASKWSTTALDRVAFDIDPTGKMRDVPNFNISPVTIKSITPRGDFYEIELFAPSGVNFAAGSPIRQHRIGWSAIFCCGADNKLTGEWKQLRHTFEPGTVAADNIFRWWKGTELARIYIDFTVPENQSLEFRNIRLEELPE